MSFFESLLVLLFAAIILLQVARRLTLPYPAMLALAGVGVAFIPGAPSLPIDPHTALALFVAPVLLDAAYDFPLSTARILWRPVAVMAIGAVLVTTVAVAWIGWWLAGLPIAAALVMGAIVAPSDAAAAVAVIGGLALPHRTASLLKGESLFNDATALILFGGALAVQMAGGFDMATGVQLAVAVPGGILVGVVVGSAMQRLTRFAGNTLGGNLLQFLNAFAVWIIAERLHLSAVLAVVACAMTVARATERRSSPRMRIHSFAVWASVVFLLNVLAFLLMGMQARTILAEMPVPRLKQAAEIAGCVIVAVIAARIAVVMGWRLLARRFAVLRGTLGLPEIGPAVVVGWAGMRGLVTLATAFALPASFPQRGLVTLVAFGVVLATLVLQGFTLSPLIRWLKLGRADEPDTALRNARRELAIVGGIEVARHDAAHDLNLRGLYELKNAMPQNPAGAPILDGYRALGLAVVRTQRERLIELRDTERVDTDGYYKLQEEIDWRELTLLPDDERRIEET